MDVPVATADQPAPRHLRRARLLHAFTIGALMAAPLLLAVRGATALARQDSTAPPAVEPVENSRNTSRTPRTIDELFDIEQSVREVVLKAVPATVGITVGNGQGSGVIVSPDGYVLTAAHVIGRPGQQAEFTLPDGTTLRGYTLGTIRELDAGMAKIDDDRGIFEGPLPYVPLGESTPLATGSWTVATGHPGGYQSGRPPVVRVGRINANRDDLLQTDNTLVGGDSGGPLFDLDGRLIGIHSRIGDSMAANVHVPIDRFVEQWQPLADGDRAGGNQLASWLRRGGADDGIRIDFGPVARPQDAAGVDFAGNDDRVGATVRFVEKGSPADEAGVQAGDRIIRMGRFEIASETELYARRPTLRDGETLEYVLLRTDQATGQAREITVEITPTDRLPRRGDPGPRNYNRPYRGQLGVWPEQGDPFGVLIREVVPNSPAEEAGLKAGDTIVAINGRAMHDVNALTRLLYPMRGGDAIVLRVRAPSGTETTRRVVLRYPQ